VTRGRILLAVATCAAVLGGLAFVTGEAVVAAAGGLCALAAASLVVRSPGLRAGLVTRRPVSSMSYPVPEADRGPLTDDGVLAEDFLRVTLQNRVAAARRALRPLSVVYLEVLDVRGDEPVRVTGQLVAAALSSTLRESDVVGRRDDGVYVFVLEDTGEDGAVWTAERLRRALVSTGHRRFRAGVASYPSHALDARGLDVKACAALDTAREWKRDRIEVATGA
jgi:hypothetical protein